MSIEDTPPIVIGGAGGSGTRLVASIIKRSGVYIGDHLNDANDNLWFTVLFRHLSVDKPDPSFELHYRIFRQAMFNEPLGEGDKEVIEDLTGPMVELYPQAISTLLDARMSTRATDIPWGWKNPITHLFLPQLLVQEPDLKFVLVVRDGLDMAFNQNQNQAKDWGELFLHRQYEDTPSYHLSYWVAIHTRMMKLREQSPQQIMFLSYDRLCEDADTELSRLSGFLGMPCTLGNETVKVPPKKYTTADLSQFDPNEVEYVRHWKTENS